MSVDRAEVLRTKGAGEVWSCLRPRGPRKDCWGTARHPQRGEGTTGERDVSMGSEYGTVRTNYREVLGPLTDHTPSVCS